MSYLMWCDTDTSNINVNRIKSLMEKMISKATHWMIEDNVLIREQKKKVQ